MGAGHVGGGSPPAFSCGSMSMSMDVSAADSGSDSSASDEELDGAAFPLALPNCPIRPLHHSPGRGLVACTKSLFLL